MTALLLSAVLAGGLVTPPSDSLRVVLDPVPGLSAYFKRLGFVMLCPHLYMEWTSGDVWLNLRTLSLSEFSLDRRILDRIMRDERSTSVEHASLGAAGVTVQLDEYGYLARAFVPAPDAVVVVETLGGGVYRGPGHGKRLRLKELYEPEAKAVDRLAKVVGLVRKALHSRRWVELIQRLDLSALGFQRRGALIAMHRVWDEKRDGPVVQRTPDWYRGRWLISVEAAQLRGTPSQAYKRQRSLGFSAATIPIKNPELDSAGAQTYCLGAPSNLNCDFVSNDALITVRLSSSSSGMPIGWWDDEKSTGVRGSKGFRSPQFDPATLKLFNSIVSRIRKL